MPFDGANYGSEVLRLLRRGRDRIMNGWTKGRLSEHVYDEVHYCLIGSIVCDENGSERRELRTHEMSRALKVIYTVLGGKREGDVCNKDISEYNDRYTTSHDDVMNVMYAAVKLQELEEFQHAE